MTLPEPVLDVARVLITLGIMFGLGALVVCDVYLFRSSAE